MEMLPDVVLHRFPGPVGRVSDCEIFHNEADGGKDWVYSQKDLWQKGVSFPYLFDDLAKQVHSTFTDSDKCCVTIPRFTVSNGFTMRQTGLFYRRLCLPGTPKSKRPSPTLCGKHFALFPLEDMPLTSYAEEINRLKATPCPLVCAAENARDGGVWPEEQVPPTSRLATWVTCALRELGNSEDEDTDIRVLAGLVCMHICSVDMTFEALLDDPYLAAFTLHALERYDPPTDDPAGQSDCFEAISQLQEATQAARAGQGQPSGPGG